MIYNNLLLKVQNGIRQRITLFTRISLLRHPLRNLQLRWFIQPLSRLHQAHSRRTINLQAICSLEDDFPLPHQSLLRRSLIRRRNLRHIPQ